MLKRQGAVIKKTEIFSRTGRIKLVWEAIPHTCPGRLGKSHGINGTRMGHGALTRPSDCFCGPWHWALRKKRHVDIARARALSTTGQKGPGIPFSHLRSTYRMAWCVRGELFLRATARWGLAAAGRFTPEYATGPPDEIFCRACYMDATRCQYCTHNGTERFFIRNNEAQVATEVQKEASPKGD